MARQDKLESRLAKARALLRKGRTGEALAALKKVLARDPGRVDALALMAEIAFRQRDYASAGKMLQTVLRARPDSFEDLNRLAVVCAMQSQLPQAAAYLRQAIAIKPDYVPAHLDLCKVTREMGLLDESIAAGLDAVRLRPDDPRTHASLALSYERFGQHGEAHRHYVRAAELAPDDVQRQFSCGVSHVGAGEKDKAQAAFRRVLAAQPGHAQAHWMLARLERCRSPDDPRLQQLERILERPGSDDDARVYLHFALGKMREDLADYERAFAHFSAGNRIENARLGYRPEAYRARVDALVDSFSAEFLSSGAGAGSASDTPLFIVGLPRSGTTLVEQILASHAEVYGAGELSWFTKAEHDLAGFIGSSSPYPRCVSELDAAKIEILANKYLAYLDTLAGHGTFRHITDKMPSNYERIGLIALLFPKARIIHCRRDPLDNAISQFCLLFQGDMEYSRDLYNLGRHYAEYQRLMAHWHACLPGRILDVQYESLVADHETQIRRLLDFTGLEWDPACLNFFESRRAVRTSSDFQVRRPIYATSVGRWKHYEKFLEPLLRGLRDGGVEAPAARAR